MVALLVKNTFVLAVLLIFASACTRKHGVLEEIRGVDGVAEQPLGEESFVEAYIEYPGAGKKWAAPQSMMIHVTARGADAARVKVTPHLYRPRKAKAGAGESRFTSEFVRAELYKLAEDFDGQQIQSSEGCLNPVKVRLVRNNGGIVVRSGCRGSGGWTKNVSRLVSDLISSSVAK